MYLEGLNLTHVCSEPGENMAQRAEGTTCVVRTSRIQLLLLACSLASLLSNATFALAKHFVPDPDATRWQYQLSDKGTVKYIPGGRTLPASLPASKAPRSSATGPSLAHSLAHSLARSLAVNLYVIDLDTAREEVPRLKKLDKRIKVVCYWSAGTYEAYRREADRDRGAYSFDSKTYLRSAMVEPMDDWPGETWLDVTNKRVWWANKKRMQFAKEIGCDAVDPDNVDHYLFESKVKNTRKDAVAFVRYLVDEAHDLGLGVGLKNAVELIKDVPGVDFYVNEQCVSYDECGAYASVAEKKAVLAVEYCDAAKELGDPTQDPACACANARKHKINMLIKRADLGADRFACQEAIFAMGGAMQSDDGLGQSPRIAFGDDCKTKTQSDAVCKALFD